MADTSTEPRIRAGDLTDEDVGMDILSGVHWHSRRRLEVLGRRRWTTEPSTVVDGECAIMTHSAEESTGLTEARNGTVEEAEAKYLAAVSPEQIIPLLLELLTYRRRLGPLARQENTDA